MVYTAFSSLFLRTTSDRPSLHADSPKVAPAARSIEARPIDRDLRLWSTLALVLYVVAAIRSKGIFHWDEHFQILEFVNVRLGRVRADTLPWEYGAKIRPWLQPFLYWSVVSAVKAFGVTKPGAWALACRLVSAVFGWWSVVAWARLYGGLFALRIARNLALAALVLTFYMPVLHARTSSENLSASAFMLALALLAEAVGMSPGRPAGSIPAARAFFIGALFGLAFEFRYQVGFMVFGALAWSWCHRRLGLRTNARVLLGLGTVVVGAWGVDVWGYHTWRVFPALAYAKANLVDGAAAKFGTSAWHSYVGMLCDFAGTPATVCILVSFVVFFATKPGHLLTWSVLPFCAVHCFIGHKETRFLFPALYFAPTLVALTVQELLAPYRLTAKVALGLAVLAAAPGSARELLKATVLPLETKFEAVERIYDESPGEKVYFIKEDPMDYGGMKLRFYAPADYASEHLRTVEQILNRVRRDAGRPSLVWLEAAAYDASRGSLTPMCHAPLADGVTDHGWEAKLHRLLRSSQYLAVGDHHLLECALPMPPDGAVARADANASP